MKLYLSGKMRPLPEHNFPEFIRVAKILRDAGHDIVSPHEYGDPSRSRGSLMTEDLLLILNECDGVVVMPGWETSPGASAEVAVSFGTEKPVFDFVETPACSPPNQFTLVPSSATSVRVPRENKYAEGEMLIGLCGFAQVGKDTTASILVDQYGFTRVAFADALRDVLYALDPIVDVGRAEVWSPTQIPGQLSDPRNAQWPVRLRQLVDDLGWDKAKVQYEEIRVLLQRLGTEAGREIIDQNLWVDLGEGKVEAAPGPSVITDCRFQNELALVKRRKGTLVWIDRPGVAPANAHASEHSVGPDDCDVILPNDGTIADLALKVAELLPMQSLCALKAVA